MPDNQRCPHQPSEAQEGTCPEPAIQFTPEAWRPQMIELPGGAHAIAIATNMGGMILMPVQAGGDTIDHYSKVREELLAGQGTAMVTGQPNTKRCCTAQGSDGVLLKSWTPEFVTTQRADHPGAQDETYLPVMVTVVDGHSGGRTASAVMDIEDMKQLHNRMGEIIQATESTAGRTVGGPWAAAFAE